MPNFIHLNLHSEFSMSDGMIKVKALFEHAQKTQMAAVALTDKMNLFAAIKFYKNAVNAGVKPIFGCELIVEDINQPPFSLIALCQNLTGYQNLTCLISKAYTEGQKSGEPRIQKTWLRDYHAGLIILSGGLKGDISQHLLNNNLDAAKASLQQYLQWFPTRFYIEIQRIGRPQEQTYLEQIIPLAQMYSIPIVATNAVCFLAADDFEAHEARVSINQGMVLADPKRPRIHTQQQYLRNESEMQQLFADLPVALRNSVEIAKRCNVSLDLGTYYLPEFPVPARQTINSYFSNLANQGLQMRLHKSSALINVEHDLSAYQTRLDQEIEVISNMGFAGYFLIVADFIQWAKQHKIPVGPGRGSGAGSLVAYALQITDLDPLAYDLLFERFLNPERVSMPDFDIDFCMDGRDRVIEYVAEKYGRECVSQIITYGSMAAKAVVRDVGRVLGYPYGFVDKIAKLVPFELGMTLKKALVQEEQLAERYQQEDEVKELLDLAQKLEGITRNAGKHAGGVVIAPTKLTDFCALYCEPDSQQIVTQFDKDDVETIGLVKFDFLGLRTLTIIDWALQAIAQTRRQEINISLIQVDDTATFELLQRCQTTAVFQLESRGMKDLIKRLQPDHFEEIIALVALFRPGPLQSGMVDDFIDRKHGRAKVEYPHPELEPILSPTYGVILYQEQVMQIAQVLAGYTLGGADLLRRAMGKKKPEEMAKQREIFFSGAVKRGVKENTATYIFDLMEKFAGYGFNKSHSAAYALLAYQTAWLKTHYPAEFMAAVLSSDMDNTDKVVNFVNDCQQLKITLLPPNINQGFYKFTVNQEQQIIYGLGAIKGVGESAIEELSSERELHGVYTSLFDFCKRLDLRKINRRVIEALIKSGAMDCFDQKRSVLMASVEKALKLAEQATRDDSRGQANLFQMFETAQMQQAYSYVEAALWPMPLQLDYEKSALGYYLSGHPLDHYQAELEQLAPRKINELSEALDAQVTIAARIAQLRFLQTKRGDRMAFLSLEDQTGRIELAVFSDVIQKSRNLLEKDTIVVVEGEVSTDEFNGGLRMRCQSITSLVAARKSQLRRCIIHLPQDIDSVILDQLQNILASFQPGICPLQLCYQHVEYRVHLKCSNQWRINPEDACLEKIHDLLGAHSVQLVY